MLRFLTAILLVTGLALVVNAQSSLLSVAKLETAAQQRVKATARLPLADETALSSIATFDAGRVPNYLRGLAQIPNAPQTFAQLFKTYLTGGTLAPELKAAMGLRIAQVNQSPYVAAHVLRLLRASESGAKMVDCLKGDKLSDLAPAEQLAIRYAELLTRDVHGITDAEFAKTRAQFNDAHLKGAFAQERFWARSIYQWPGFRRTQWIIWQRDNRAKIQGVSVPVDLNDFRGDDRAFDAFARLSEKSS